VWNSFHVNGKTIFYKVIFFPVEIVMESLLWLFFLA